MSGAVVLAASVTTAVLAGHHQPGLPFRYPAGGYASFVAAGGGSLYVGYSVSADGSGTAGVLSMPADAGTGGAQATLDASDYSDSEGGASSLAADASGNLYYVTGAGGVDELPRGASTPRQLPYSTERFLDAQALAADGAGDVFVSSGDSLVEIPAGSTADGQDVPVLIGDNSPQQILIDQVAVDGHGDLFATTDLGTVVELPARPGGGWSSAVVLPFAGPATAGGLASDDLIAEGTYADGLGLAVDAAGDVFVSDLFAGQLYELPAEPGGGYGSQLPVPLAGLQNPASVTVDAAGDLYVAGRGEVAMLPRPAAPASGVTLTSTVITSVSPAHPAEAHPMTVHVKVTAASGSAAPAGKADISDGDAGDDVCTAVLTAGPGTTSTGSCQLTEGFGGDYTLTAVYQGAAPFSSSAASRPAAVDARPWFQLASPSLGAQASYGYDFVAAGFPAPSYSLGEGAPSWLSINQATGMVSGIVPPGNGSFTYSVTAANRAGSVTAGPFTVGTGQGEAGLADLAARLSCPADALAGTAVTCSLTVTNHGPGAVAGAMAAMTVPGELGAIGDSGLENLGCESSNCMAATEVVTWQIGKLRAGASVSERLAFTVAALNAPGIVTLHGCVDSEALDGQQNATISAARLRIIGLVVARTGHPEPDSPVPHRFQLRTGCRAVRPGLTVPSGVTLVTTAPMRAPAARLAPYNPGSRQSARPLTHLRLVIVSVRPCSRPPERIPLLSSDAPRSLSCSPPGPSQAPTEYRF